MFADKTDAPGAALPIPPAPGKDREIITAGETISRPSSPNSAKLKAGIHCSSKVRPNGIFVVAVDGDSPNKALLHRVITAVEGRPGWAGMERSGGHRCQRPIRRGNSISIELDHVTSSARSLTGE